MNLNIFYEKLDKLFNNNDISGVGKLLLDSYQNASVEKDLHALLAIDNELIGFYRSLGDYDGAIRHADEALDIFKKTGLEDTIHYATTLLNTATALRGMGKYMDSIEKYEKALNIYKKHLPMGDYRIASLYNNMSTVYENLKEYEKAKELLLKASEIICVDNNNYIEYATTLINLSQICIELGELKEGEEYVKKAVDIFEKNNATDNSHYAGALAAYALLLYRMNFHKESAMYYSRAMENVESILGKNDYYYVLKDNLNQILKQMEDELEGN